MDRRKDRHSPGAARWPSSTHPKTKPEGCPLGLSKAFMLPEIPTFRKFSLFDDKGSKKSRWCDHCWENREGWKSCRFGGQTQASL